MRQRFVITFLVGLSICLSSLGSETNDRITASLTFERHVRPILKAHCFHCHGEGEKLNGGVDLRLRRFLADKVTDDGSVMTPGRPEASRMMQLIRSGEMPKGEKKLAEHEIAMIERWIVSGAKAERAEPTDLPKGFHITDEERNFWAFQPIRRPAVPKWDAADRVRTSVDVFVRQTLREEGLNFAPEADPLTLIRRVHFDLLGLPPSPDAVDEFLRDTSPDAYERLVDRVLASRHYGERWARHWLDVAGYADSNGYSDADSPRPHAWRYRDYVIRALNADKPWNEFLVEQLAGDELAGVTHEDAAAKAADSRVQELLAATGFLRMAPDGTGDDVPDQNLARNQTVAETIKIVSSSLLGLTVGCAQCHDHRYDPISHVDYHRMRAVFEPALDWKKWRKPGERLVSLATAEDRKKAEAIEAEARKIDEAANQMRKDFLEKVFEKELAKLPEDIRETVRLARNTPRKDRTTNQVLLLKQYPSADVQGALDLYDPEAQKKVQAKHDEAGKLRGTKPAEPFIMALTEVAGRVPETFLFHRGDHEQPKQTVEPGELEILRACAVGGDLKSQISNAKSNERATSGRRLAYARWLTSGQHPLVARVLVNRFWMHHFGRGLVNSPGDFGRLGERPTHPELLDWLASEFVANGWRLKPLHRLLMTSTVYRQSSRHDASLDTDPENRFYARMKLRRLDAETLRDSVLAVSGTLNTEPFGPAVPIARDGAGRVMPGKQKLDARSDPTIVEPIGDAEYRRSIYVEVRRQFPLTVLESFDAPVMSPNCEVRNVSTVAPQSLTMLNDTFLVAQAQRFAERLFREHPGDVRAQIQRAWRLAYGAAPNERETLDSLIYLAEQTERIRARGAMLVSAKKSEKPDKAPAPPDIPTQALASFCQALMSANRFLHVD